MHLKAFTMVEISFFAKIGKMTPREVLVRLKEAGLDSMPGGGAEIFSDRVRHIICDHKIDGDEWLETARTAHEVGLKSNATMLYGHVENDEDRVDHLLQAARACRTRRAASRRLSRWRSIPTTRRCSICRRPPACST